MNKFQLEQIREEILLHVCGGGGGGGVTNFCYLLLPPL